TPSSYILLFSFSHHSSPPSLYPLSLHDALPIWYCRLQNRQSSPPTYSRWQRWQPRRGLCSCSGWQCPSHSLEPESRSRSSECDRSEEHTSELQSHLNLVCRLLLEKKKKKT